MKYQLYFIKNLLLSLTLLVASLVTQNTYAMEEEEINYKFFITNVTNETNKNLVFLINNKPTGIKAGETKNLRKEVKLKRHRTENILLPSEDWLVRIIDSQTRRRFLHINIIQKLLDDQTSEVFVYLLDVCNVENWWKSKKNVTVKQILGEYIDSWWQTHISNNVTHRFNIQLVLKKGKERLEDSKLNVLAEEKVKQNSISYIVMSKKN
ncbi:MAG TPA: hypothetical protein ENI08_00360 [Candidatus Dependentiae bacterium]|nr:hypothetical protein [Candidatus Dependentiae bacterium]